MDLKYFFFDIILNEEYIKISLV